VKPPDDGGSTPHPDAHPSIVSSQPSPGDQSHARITFACPACGTRLSIGSHQAGTSGPCPVCGGHVVSPDAPAQSPRPSGKRDSTRRRGRIRADAVIDHAHLENRESIRSLKVIAFFILALCACVAVAWFLRDHLSR
jgi:hypothetical protein